MTTQPKAGLTAVLRLLAVSASLEQRFNPSLGSLYGLTLQHFLLLLNVARAPLKRMRRVDLAAALSLGASSITHIADPLEKEGLLARESDSRDARVIYVALTELGAQRLEQAQLTLGALSSKLFDERWSTSDIEQFSTRLGHLTYGLASNILGE
jgi:DNA-binding MarR family transcriptional regulator